MTNKECEKCHKKPRFEDKKYCEECYNFGLYLLATYLDCKEGKISEEEANLLLKRANEERN